MIKSAFFSNEKERLHVEVIRRETIVKTEETINFPMLVKLTDGYGLRYSVGVHGGDEERGEAIISHDGGKSWQPHPYYWDNLIGYLADGTILTFPFPPQEFFTQPLRFDARRLSPRGELIEQFTAFVHIPFRSALHGHGRILSFSDSSLVATFYGHQEGHKFYTTAFARSTDGGRNWEYLSHITAEVGREGYCEPDIEFTRDGRIICLMRVGGAPLYQMISDDGCRTWSKPFCIGWGQVDPRLLLLENGTLVCSTGRPHTYLLFNLDGCGEEWQPPFWLHTHTGCSYTSMLQTVPNEIVVAYSDSTFTRPTDTHPREFQSINWVFLRVERIAESPCRCDFR